MALQTEVLPDAVPPATPIKNVCFFLVFDDGVCVFGYHGKRPELLSINVDDVNNLLDGICVFENQCLSKDSFDLVGLNRPDILFSRNFAKKKRKIQSSFQNKKKITRNIYIKFFGKTYFEK
mmetsp:Transcript_101445/g.124197  ORF Transcript_101445/g.124197 Transcript_101445/m.124197 type:complete len:121 (-) Transcript_101445:323-685(-)